MNKYLCIEDSPGTWTSSGEGAIVGIPLALIRAGVNLSKLVPAGNSHPAQ